MPVQAKLRAFKRRHLACEHTGGWSVCTTMAVPAWRVAHTPSRAIPQAALKPMKEEEKEVLHCFVSVDCVKSSQQSIQHQCETA